MPNFTNLFKNIKPSPASVIPYVLEVGSAIADGIKEREQYKNKHCQEITALRDERVHDKEIFKRTMANLKSRKKGLKNLLELKAKGVSKETLSAYREYLDSDKEE